MTMLQLLLSPLRALQRYRSFRILTLALYYCLIIAALVFLYGRGDFSTPEFVYQGF